MPSYSGLYDGVYNTPYASLANTVEMGNGPTQLARVLARRPYGRAVLRELMLTLNGAAAGATALETHVRRKAQTPVPGVFGGGRVAIETFTEINRVTTATDKANLDRALTIMSRPATYVADRSGVGGGGKLDY